MLKGVGPKLSLSFRAQSIATVGDLGQLPINHLALLAKQTHGVSLTTLVKLHGQAGLSKKGQYQNCIIHHRKSSNPYKSLYGDEWKEVIVRSASMQSHVCVSKLIEHIVEASSKIMRGSKHEDDWYFMHDALVQMTCKTTIAWMKTKGHYKRWFLPVAWAKRRDYVCRKANWKQSRAHALG